MPEHWAWLSVKKSLLWGAWEHFTLPPSHSSVNACEKTKSLGIFTSRSGSEALSVIHWLFFFFSYAFLALSCPEIWPGPACSCLFISSWCSSAKNRAVLSEHWRTERKSEDVFPETAVYNTTSLSRFFIFCLVDNWDSQRNWLECYLSFTFLSRSECWSQLDRLKND